MSIAILGDENPNWRPHHHAEKVYGCDLDFRFPVIKITDYGERLDELEKSENPFAAVIVAHLMTLKTANQPLDRCQWKLRILRALYRRGIAPNQLRQLFRVIDWLMQLPPAIEQQFWQELEQIESETNMPYVTSVERMGREKGLWAGKIQMAQRLLRIEQTPSDVLLAKPLAELQEIFTQLEAQLDLPEAQE